MGAWILTAVFLAVGFAAAPLPVRAQEITLRQAHFMPAGSWQQTEIFLAWAGAVEQASGGRIKVDVYPAQTLGSAVDGYDNAASGVADIAWTVQGYTANRFPLSQIMELPGLFERADIGSCAFQRLYDEGDLKGEYTDTHVLFLHVHGPGHLHTRTRPVAAGADLQGLRIRQPTAVVGQLLRSLGAEPVGMPAPGIYEATQRGTIDGFLLPWEALTSFRAEEVVRHHTELGLYALAFVETMNRDAYEALPADLRAVIDGQSGLAWAVRAGAGYDRADRVGRANALARGNQMHIPAPAERAAWEAIGGTVTEHTLADLENRGLPARRVYARAQALVAECRDRLR